MITAIITLIQLYAEYIENKTTLDTNIKNINTGYRNGITNAVWLDDKVQLISILEGVVALPDIEYIEIRVNGKLYAARGEEVKSNSISSVFPLYHRHDDKLLTIGETYVEADMSGIYQRLLNHTWAILGLNGIKTFFVAIFMYYIFNRLVVSRLEGLSNFLRSYAIDQNNDIRDIDARVENQYPDEISDIVTALKSMHNQLSVSVKELLGLKKTLDLSLDGVFMFHPVDYKIFYANAGAVSLTGYSNEELLNMTPMSFCDELTESLFTSLEDSSARVKMNQPVENQGAVIEASFKPKQGEAIPVRLLLQYLHPENQEPRFVFMARDISEHINAQADIQASLEEAKTANAELESFSYSISHDLRTPLRSIDGFSQLLWEDYSDKIDEAGKDCIQRVRKNAQYMGLLIDDMLSLSNVNRGELKREVQDLSELARSSIKKLRDLDPQRKITVDIEPGIKGYVDKALFENLLDNLFGNAWKYTGKTTNARIEFGSLEKEGETVYFVRDNGAGFNMRYAKKLFIPFHRLHTEEQFEGTGIGLATVSRILSRHHGRVWAEAEVDKGATFYFTLGKARLLPGETPG